MCTRLLTPTVRTVVLAVLLNQLPAQVQFDELPRRNLPGGTSQTQAVAHGDVDGDGDEDLVFGNDGRNGLYLNRGFGIFDDVTATRLPVDADDTEDVALGDVDGDGDLDIVLANVGRNRLYVNDGTGAFTDATAARMPGLTDHTNSATVADIDADGDLDLVFGNGQFNPGQQDRLYVNDGAGFFHDGTAALLPQAIRYTEDIAAGDVDGDGDVDLVIGVAQAGLSYSGYNHLLLNDGTGRFTDATAGHLPPVASRTLGLALGDVDGDGDLDLAAANDVSYYVGGPSRLYLNDGNGVFTDVSATHLRVSASLQTQAVAMGDVDRDGDLDLLFGHSERGSRTPGQSRLYLPAVATARRASRAPRRRTRTPVS